MQRRVPCGHDSAGAAGKATGGKNRGRKCKGGKSKDRIRGWLIESWELDQVVVGDAFYGIAGFAPGAEAAGDYEYFES